MLSYLPAGRELALTPDGKWARKGRQDSRPGKLMAQLLHPRLVSRIDPKRLNEFATKFKVAEAAIENRYTVSIGDYWREAYSPEAYTEDCEPFYSCMWSEDVAPFYRAAGARILTVRDNSTGRLAARAVFWPRVKTGAGTISLVDRIYSATPDLVEIVKEWACANGHHHKAQQNADTARHIATPGGANGIAGLSVEPPDGIDVDDIYVPYMDTFYRMDDGGRLTNTGRDDDRYQFRETNGTAKTIAENHDGEVQDVDGNWIAEDTAVEVGGDYYDRDDYRIVCCKHGGEYVLREECYEVEVSSRQTIIIHRDYVTRL